MAKEIWDEYKWNFWNPDKEPLPENPDKNYNIAICTTCMGRTYDLKQTLPINILDNSDYKNCVFVVLNYNSKDDLDEFMKDRMLPYIKSGKVLYVHTTQHPHFQMSHAKNVAMKAAFLLSKKYTGLDIEFANNVDADNFTGYRHVSVLNKILNTGDIDKMVVAKGKRLAHGRYGFSKKAFMKMLCGYPEFCGYFSEYGGDDANIRDRAMCLGKFKLMWWGNLGRFSDRIKTPRKKITENMKEKNWKYTEDENKKVTEKQIKEGILAPNKGKKWGADNLLVNFRHKESI